MTRSGTHRWLAEVISSQPEELYAEAGDDAGIQDQGSRSSWRHTLQEGLLHKYCPLVRCHFLVQVAKHVIRDQSA